MASAYLHHKYPYKAYNPDHLYVFVHVCIGNQSCLIYIYMYVYIHHTSSLIAHMHWSSICMVGLSHSLIQTFFCFADVYPVCNALHMHIMPCDRLVFVELHIHDYHNLAMHRLQNLALFLRLVLVAGTSSHHVKQLQLSKLVSSASAIYDS